jgi:hypothetical protein
MASKKMGGSCKSGIKGSLPGSSKRGPIKTPFKQAVGFGGKR